jgi:hypothetical protein
MLYPNHTNGLGCTVLWIVLFMDKYTAVSFPYFLWMDAYCGIAVDAFSLRLYISEKANSHLGDGCILWNGIAVDAYCEKKANCHIY